MSTHWKPVGYGLIALTLALLLGACGGGGGSSSGQSGTLVDPAKSYAGVSTQAKVTSANAEELAIGGYAGDSIGSNLGTVTTAKSVAAANTNKNVVRQLAQELKLAARRLELPRKAVQLRSAKPVSGTAKLLQRVATYQQPGDNGGTMTYTLDINDATNSFFGTINFDAYTSNGVVFSGDADILGTFDANYQDFSRITLSFKSLTLSNSTDYYTLIGTLSWGFNFPAATETLSINMVLLNKTSGNRSCWFKNYESITTYGNGFLSETIAGRYYDSAHGYVELATTAPLITYTGNSWPSQGSLLFSGQQNTWASLTFSSNTLQIDADTNGDGTADWLVQRDTNQQPPSNVPPVAAAGADQSVSQWATVLLDGSASHDANSDPLSYYWSFQSCPQNACPSLANANTTTPSFSADRTGTYLLQLTVYDGQSSSPADTVNVSVTANSGSSPNLLQKTWEYGLYGTSIGQAGLFSADLDGDGTEEVIASATPSGYGTNCYWYIVRKTANGTYEQIWRSEMYPVTVVAMALADINGDGRDDILVGLADGIVIIYDGPTRQVIKTIKAGNSLAALAVADLNGDGKKELVTSDGIGVAVYATASGTLQWSAATGGGSSIAIGNVDGDPALEIVTTGYGGKGYVIDGVSRSIEWEYLNGFGAKVRLGELDGDGMEEIIGASSWYKITVFDADRKTPVWEISTNLDVGALLVTDADGDGVPEIIYGDSQWGKIHAVDARTHGEKWSVNNPEHGVSGIALGDVDNDGKLDLLWGAGGTSSGPDHLYFADPATGTIKWQSIHVDGPLSVVAVGDVDDDGEDEIVMVSRSSDSGYAEGIIHIFNARTHAFKYQEKLGTQDLVGVRSIVICDVDGDGKTEYVVTTVNDDGVIRVYDGVTHTLKRETASYSSKIFTAMAISDVDNDGKTEIVAGHGSNLIVFDGATLQEKWRSTDLGGSYGEIYAIKLADLDGDSHPDIIASVTGNRLVVFDGVNHDLKLMSEHPSRALEVADVDGDGAKEILVGRGDGTIDVFNGKTFALKKSVFTFGKSAIDALKVTDLDGDGVSEWLLTGNGFLTVLDGTTQDLKWRSRDLAGNLGQYNHIAVKDIDGDGRKEIFLGSNQALYQFR